MTSFAFTAMTSLAFMMSLQSSCWRTNRQRYECDEHDQPNVGWARSGVEADRCASHTRRCTGTVADAQANAGSRWGLSCVLQTHTADAVRLTCRQRHATRLGRSRVTESEQRPPKSSGVAQALRDSRAAGEMWADAAIGSVGRAPQTCTQNLRGWREHRVATSARFDGPPSRRCGAVRRFARARRGSAHSA
jgi:hypothetical protein